MYQQIIDFCFQEVGTQKFFEKDKALTRRFQTIEVKETTVEETIKILNGLKSNYENYHNVKYSDNAIKLAVELSNKYINDRFLPDKAIDIMDEACSRVRLKAFSLPPSLKEMEDILQLRLLLEPYIVGLLKGKINKQKNR